MSQLLLKDAGSSRGLKTTSNNKSICIESTSSWDKYVEEVKARDSAKWDQWPDSWDKYVEEVKARDSAKWDQWPDGSCQYVDWGQYVDWAQYAENTQSKDPYDWGDWGKETVYFRHEDWSFKMEIDSALVAKMRMRARNPGCGYGSD